MEPIGDFQSRIVLCLKDQGGPPELAPQLIAIAEKHDLINALEKWVTWHRDPEWSAAQFEAWCNKYWQAFHQMRNYTRENYR